MRDVLEKLRRGELTVDEAENLLRPHVMGVDDLARLDVNRRARTGIPEIVLAEGKTPEQVVAIVRSLVTSGSGAIVSRLTPGVHELTVRDLGGSAPGTRAEYHDLARVGVYGERRVDECGGRIAMISAGTSDIAVAEEARVTAEEMGAAVTTHYDVGVAGVHRLSGCLGSLADDRVSVYVVAAGREGALPTLVAGLVDSPVIGLPVSVGYGHGGGGQAALMAMLQSCSPLLVVNIDAGVVAGACAALIAGRIAGGTGGPKVTDDDGASSPSGVDERSSGGDGPGPS
jgi:NCAIR mutase (PurE)-related protein